MGIGTCSSCRYYMDERPPKHCDNDSHVYHPWPNDPDYVPPALPTLEDLQAELDDPVIGIYVVQTDLPNGNGFMRKSHLIRRSDALSK